MMKIGFIGAGKVGFSLGKYFCDHQLEVTGYYSRTPASALEAAAFTHTKRYESLTQIVQENDVLFVAVSDSAISAVWESLKKLPIKNKIVCHCSGALASAIFSDIQQAQAFGYSVHPLCAMHDKYTSYLSLAQALFTVEGDAARLDKVCSLLRQTGSRLQVIAPEHKSRYHAAAVVVSNHTVALLQIGMDLLAQCGFSQADARQALLPLLSGTVENLMQATPANALTGPVERGDTATVGRHLQTLGGKDRALYRLLSEKLMCLAQQKHPERDDSALEELLHYEAYDYNDTTTKTSPR